MLDPSIVQEVVSAWQADEAHPYRYRRKRNLPSLPILQRFIDSVFLATLRDEEGRPVLFSVSLISEEEAKEPVQVTAFPPLILEQPVLLSSSTLPKLAAAFDPDLSTLAVRWDSARSELFVWAVFLHSYALNRFTEVPVGVEGNANIRPDFFTAIARGRASIAIARGNSLIGTFQAGYFVAATPTPFTSTSLGGHVHTIVQRDALFASHGNHYWHHVRDAFELLLSEAARRGHGGTIILLPSQPPAQTSLYVTKHILRGSFGLRKTLEQCAAHSQSIEFGIAYRKVAYESIQRIAQLAAVDGALILTAQFEVIAFGATLTAPRSEMRDQIGPDGGGRAADKPFDISRYGTRHRSAFDFVAAYPEAIVFVISQDGPIRAFRRESDNIIYVWPDCTASMFV